MAIRSISKEPFGTVWFLESILSFPGFLTLGLAFATTFQRAHRITRTGKKLDTRRPGTDIAEKRREDPEGVSVSVFP